MTAPLQLRKELFMKKNTTRQLAFDAMLCALCAILGCLSLDMKVIKITFESLPVLAAALLFGPLDGLAVGAVGTLISQIYLYGLSYTTPMWMAPYMLLGLGLGIYARCKSYKYKRAELFVSVILGEIFVTALNTVAIYVDSIIFNYYYPGIITASLLVRLLICVVKAGLFGIVLWSLIPAVKRVTADR